MPTTGLAELRLTCLLRSGDGYVVRGSGRLGVREGPAHVDISFGDAGDHRRAADLERAVRAIQRWCDLGTVVALLAEPAGVLLRDGEGLTVPLPRAAV